MTLGELKDSVKWEGKIQNDTEALAELNNIVNDAIIFIGSTHPELLLIESPITYDADTDNPTNYVNALSVQRVVFNPTNGDEPFELPEQSQVVGPAIRPNYPKCYYIEGNASTANASPKGLRVVLDPPLSDSDNESFNVWWKKVPALTADNDLIPNTWIPYLKRELLNRLSIQRAKTESEVAKIHEAAAARALQATVSNTSESTAPTN